MKNLLPALLLSLSLPCSGQAKKLTTDDSLRAAFGHYFTYPCSRYTYRWKVTPSKWTMYRLDAGKLKDSIPYYPKLGMYQYQGFKLYIDVPNYIGNNFPRNCSCFQR